VDPLRSEILQRLRRGVSAWTPSERRRLERRLHAEQRRRNPVYRRWTQAEGCAARPVALPIVAWREARVYGGGGRPAAVFESSGTTSALRGVHFFRDLAVYEESVVSGWAWAVSEWSKIGVAPAWLRRGGGGVHWMALMSSASEAPRSSLSRMLEILARRTQAASLFWARRKGRWNWGGLARRLRAAEGSGDGLVLFGTAFGWVRFSEWCAARGRRFRFGSRALAIETGGTKGRSREISRDELHRAIARLLGVPRRGVQSEYSMCELSSQAWSFEGRFRFPPWCRARVASRVGGARRRAGARGVLEIYDLANTDSCAFVRTEDLAEGGEEGFTLAGRAPRAAFKGCSLAHEQDDRVGAA